MNNIYFWSNSNYHWMSNFEMVEINIDNHKWASVEHYYQAQKYTDLNLQEQIKGFQSPGKVKRFSRKHPPRADWDMIKEEVMLKALRAKYQLEPYRSLLISTGSDLIFEDSPKDLFWGTGELQGSGKGLNTLGKLLMQVRSELIK